MSNLSTQLHQDCAFQQGCNAVELIIQPQAKDLGGFSVRRSLPNQQRRMVGPWIFFDHMGPAEFPAGEGVDVRPHPHIGIATVTYLFEGEISHRDSLGNDEAIQPGDLNLMVAGRGIVHSERQSAAIKAAPQRMHALQLWLALPADQEEIEPAFYHYDKGELPAATVEGVPLRVMIGSAYGLTSPVKTFADTLYVEAALSAGQSLTLPQAAERAVYVAQGEVRIGDTTIPEHALVILSDVDGVRIEASSDARIAVIGGENLGPRFIDWNFVSSRKERIEQAKQDWVAGRFPKVPGDEQEFIPLPGSAADV